MAAWTREDSDGAAGSAAVSGFVHDGLLFDSPDELVGIAAPFVLDGLAAGDAVAIAVSSQHTDHLRNAIGDDPRVVILEGGDAYHSRAAATIAGWRRLAAQRTAEGFGRLRVIGEVNFGSTTAEQLEWQRYEAVINHAFAATSLWGLCLFDTRRRTEPVLSCARHTHPQLVDAGGRRANPAFVDPARYLGALPVPVEPLEATAPRLVAGNVSDFVGLRHSVQARLAETGGPSDLLEDFLLAVDEMTSNAFRHGSPPVRLSLWTAPGTVVCTISDGGTGWEDPFAGYGPAHGADLSHGGMGLWLARQLCDHVALRRGEHGASVRLTTRWA